MSLGKNFLEKIALFESILPTDFGPDLHFLEIIEKLNEKIWYETCFSKVHLLFAGGSKKGGSYE